MSKIMIVDNDITVQMDLEEYFQQSRHQLVGIVESEEEAVSMARETKPDVILLEIDLPGERDGIEIAQEVKRQIDVGIVFMTVCSDFATVCRAKQASPLAYVLKPFDVREIGAAIEIALNTQAANEELQLANRRLEFRVAEQEVELRVLKAGADVYPRVAGIRIPVSNGAKAFAVGPYKWRFIP